MMSDQNAQKHITNCQEYLSQGDVFHIDLVAPMADPEKRIFRTIDGRHASVIKPNGSDGRIFSYDELMSVIQALQPRQRVFPFQKTSDGKSEMVLVYADLLEYFIIISQTCDISGIDSPTKPTCTILPVITLAQYCRGQVSFSYIDPETGQKISQMTSIPEYFTEQFDP